jgi:polyisoprenoid-binding protein YceI
MHGNLDFHGVNHPATFDVEFLGTNKDPWGNTKAIYTIAGKISRKDWGMVWNVGLETGGWLVSDEVRINCEIQLSKPA